jgi:hypothetical protein
MAIEKKIDVAAEPAGDRSEQGRIVRHLPQNRTEDKCRCGIAASSSEPSLGGDSFFQNHVRTVSPVQT